MAREELERILDSPDFRNSHQSQRLLRHVVELTLEGQIDELRERAIAVALFGREVGFDTNEDPIVRVRANEVRKRLTRYYESLQETPPVRLELHAGSYRVEFRWKDTGVEALLPGEAKPQSGLEASSQTAGPSGSLAETALLQETPPVSAALSVPAARRRRAALVLLLTSAVLAVGIVSWPRKTPIDAFWQPLLAGGERTIVCIGHPVVYRFSTRLMQERRSRGVSFLDKQTGVMQFQPGETVDGKDIVPIEDQYIGLGSAHATANIAAWLSNHGTHPELRFGGDLSFTELKETPAVLVSFANRWTMDFMSKFRFVAELQDGRSLIRDQQTGKAWELQSLQDNGRTEEDYVLISRTFYSESGQCLITVAGLTQYGTQSAGEIVTQPALLEAALAEAGEDWEKRNLQLLFHVRVVNHTPGPPKLLAVHTW
jgi:hypothetical protein